MMTLAAPSIRFGQVKAKDNERKSNRCHEKNIGKGECRILGD